MKREGVWVGTHEEGGCDWVKIRWKGKLDFCTTVSYLTTPFTTPPGPEAE